MASIHKREDGTWRGQVNKNGTRKSFSGKTKKKLQKIQTYLEDLNTYGSELDKTTATISEWLYKHLFTNLHSNIANSTFDRYMNILKIILLTLQLITI